MIQFHFERSGRVGSALWTVRILVVTKVPLAVITSTNHVPCTIDAFLLSNTNNVHIGSRLLFFGNLKNALRYSNECAASTIAPGRPELCTHSLACLALYDSSSFAPGRAKGHTLLDACLGSCRVILQGFFWTHITWKVTS